MIRPQHSVTTQRGLGKGLKYQTTRRPSCIVSSFSQIVTRCATAGEHSSIFSLSTPISSEEVATNQCGSLVNDWPRQQQEKQDLRRATQVGQLLHVRVVCSPYRARKTVGYLHHAYYVLFLQGTLRPRF